MTTKLEKIERDLRKTADALLNEYTLPKHKDNRNGLEEAWRQVHEAVGMLRFLRTGEL